MWSERGRCGSICVLRLRSGRAAALTRSPCRVLPTLSAQLCSLRCSAVIEARRRWTRLSLVPRRNGMSGRRSRTGQNDRGRQRANKVVTASVGRGPVVAAVAVTYRQTGGSDEAVGSRQVMIEFIDRARTGNMGRWRRGGIWRSRRW
jgi:hypothetical protein